MNNNPDPPPGIPDRKYTSPPVIEALCEVYFSGSRWDGTIPGEFYQYIKEEYPKKSERKQVGVRLVISPEGAETQQQDLETRTRFARADDSRLIQLGRDVLVVNQLLPYPHYEAWREVVLNNLRLYHSLAAPEGIRRLGIRYINRVTVPTPKIRMESYFRVYPEMPLELRTAHGAFMLQLVMDPVHPGHELTLTLNSAPPAMPGHTSVLLNLYDAIKVDGQVTFEGVKQLLDDAHENLVYTFENTVTDEARKLFGEVTNA